MCSPSFFTWQKPMNNQPLPRLCTEVKSPCVCLRVVYVCGGGHTGRFIINRCTELFTLSIFVTWHMGLLWLTFTAAVIPTSEKRFCCLGHLPNQVCRCPWGKEAGWRSRAALLDKRWHKQKADSLLCQVKCQGEQAMNAKFIFIARLCSSQRVLWS